MYFEWGSKVFDPTEAILDDGIDVKLNDGTSTEPGIIFMYDIKLSSCMMHCIPSGRVRSVSSLLSLQPTNLTGNTK